jgi:hypothetical protein
MNGSLTWLAVVGINAGIAFGSDSSGDLIRELTETKQIETAQIGDSAQTSKVTRAFLEILARPDRKELLLRIFQRSETDAGRIYALAGLYPIDKDTYVHCLSQMNSQAVVKGLWYDVVRNFTVKELQQMIENGELLRELRRPTSHH